LIPANQHLSAFDHWHSYRMAAALELGVDCFYTFDQQQTKQRPQPLHLKLNQTPYFPFSISTTRS